MYFLFYLIINPVQNFDFMLDLNLSNLMINCYSDHEIDMEEVFSDFSVKSRNEGQEYQYSETFEDESHVKLYDF